MPGLQDTLAREHEYLNGLFERLLAAFQADARVELGSLWTEFDSRLRSHMSLEEEYILPEFAKVDVTEANALRAEHVRIRELLTELDIAVDLHLARESTIADLVTMLKAHAEREDRLMYRWAASNLGAGTRKTIREEIRRAFHNIAVKSQGPC
jgi:hemerythrin